MSRDWEATFREWAKPSSPTEQQKCENAERMIRDAISESETLGSHKIEVFAQGSYRNNTNVRQESDVDICVRCMDTYFCDYTFVDGLTAAEVGNVTSSYTFAQFRNDVEAALVAKFGRAGVQRGKKAFDIHQNSYRVDADVVACFEHRRYHRGFLGAITYESGTSFIPDGGTAKIVNWPHQQYKNGVGKNEKTGNRYKYMVRVLKRLRNEMADGGLATAKPIPSFLSECLVWNVPLEGFGHSEYRDDVRYILAKTFNNTMNDDKAKEWGEVSELKYLFRDGQPWTKDQAHAFLGAAWDYVGFK